MKNQIIDS